MGSHYLFELGTEELPPKSLSALSDSLSQSIQASLASDKLSYDKIELFASPRRLAFLISNLADHCPTNENKVWGPPAKIAYDDNGELSKAALGFCKRNHVEASDISVESDGKVDKICCLVSTGGEATATLLPAYIEKALTALPIAKRMRWGASHTEFVRPAHWFILMCESTIIPATILGLKSGNTSTGHRSLSHETITITSADQYPTLLKEQGKVIACFNERKELIRSQIQNEAIVLNGQAVIDEDLLNEVTALVEWPQAVSGKFDAEFLAVPKEALISSMKDHQKYFHLVDQNNQLLPRFITIANIETNNSDAIKLGNEKVIRPRLADAAFFYKTDKKVSSSTRREKLKSVVFQDKLGSIFDKTERIKKIAVFIANRLNIKSDAIVPCAELCKSDLVSTMVYEFPEMQGIAGYHYALNDDHEQIVADGIRDHYLPKFAGDVLPKSNISAIIGIADRIDTLCGIFGIGQIPTGSKDPFALRRASVSCLRLLVENNFRIDLAELLTYTSTLYSNLNHIEQSNSQCLAYMLERFGAWFEDQGIHTHVWQAVAAKKLSEPFDICERVHAVHTFYQSTSAKSLASANKRVANILAKSNFEISSSINTELFEQSQESKLYDAINDAHEIVSPLIKSQSYNDALTTLSTLRKVVDDFFENVMVMADDEAVKQNRLALLFKLRELFLKIADIRFLA